MNLDWRVKAGLHTVLSTVPFGSKLNYTFQRRVSHSLPASDVVFRECVQSARDHLDASARFGDKDAEDSVFFEFGAGWHLGVAFALAALGVRHQTVIDIRPLIRPELLEHTVARLNALSSELDLHVLPPFVVEADPLTALNSYGIEYRAPVDASATGLAAGSIDCVTSTSTLEHIPAADIPAILAECRRLLRPGGLLTAWIDYKDHYASFDRSVGPYNFLRYSDAKWNRLYSPSMHYQNRLRHDDYVRLFEEAAFELVEVREIEATPEDLASLSTIEPHPMFRSYSDGQLAVRDGWFVARSTA